MAKKYRVGIIGRTGKGNYGHGLDTVWKHVDQIEVAAVADEHEGGRAALLQSSHTHAHPMLTWSHSLAPSELVYAVPISAEHLCGDTMPASGQ